ncbi:hypothetical protein ABZX85_20540 [Streptomyces sp. NPDC004539]
MTTEVKVTRGERLLEAAATLTCQVGVGVDFPGCRRPLSPRVR